MTSLTIKI